MALPSSGGDTQAAGKSDDFEGFRAALHPVSLTGLSSIILGSALFGKSNRVTAARRALAAAQGAEHSDKD